MAPCTINIQFVCNDLLLYLSSNTTATLYKWNMNNFIQYKIG